MSKCFCPSCKRRISGSAKRCFHCGFVISKKPLDGGKHIRAASIAVIAITILIACALYLSYSRHSLSAVVSPTEEIQVETLKDINGLAFTSNEVVARLNSFLHEAGSDSLHIKKLVLTPKKTVDIYHGLKENNDINISITTPKGGGSIISITVTSMVSGENEPTAFITYCLGLMNIFTPTMKADIRQKVLFNMMGYVKNENMSFCEENTYIIADTKYAFTYSKQEGLRMYIEQMPKLELYSGDLSVM